MSNEHILSCGPILKCIMEHLSFRQIVKLLHLNKAIMQPLVLLWLPIISFTKRTYLYFPYNLMLCFLKDELLDFLQSNDTPDLKIKTLTQIINNNNISINFLNELHDEVLILVKHDPNYSTIMEPFIPVLRTRVTPHKCGFAHNTREGLEICEIILSL